MQDNTIIELGLRMKQTLALIILTIINLMHPVIAGSSVKISTKNTTPFNAIKKKTSG